MKNVVKKVSLLMVMASVNLLVGCASIVNGTHQSVSVITPPAVAAKCKLENSKGTWYVNSTPGSVVVHRAYGDLHITCTKKGYHLASKTIKSHTKGMAFGNVVFGGVIGGGVDVANGSAFDYPQTIVIPMVKKQ